MLEFDDAPAEVASRTLDAFAAENEELEALLASLAPDLWWTPTPSDGWTIRQQLAELICRTQRTIDAMTDRNRLLLEVERTGRIYGQDDWHAKDVLAHCEPDLLLLQWRDVRERFATTCSRVLGGAILPLQSVGKERLVSIASAYGLMKAWAHAQDIADGLDLRRTPNERLWYIADLGIGMDDTRFATHGVVPLGQLNCRIELTSPIGAVWVWGSPGAEERLTGAAEDFCLFLTRRRTRSMVDLVATAEVEVWMTVAPTYLAPPGRSSRLTPARRGTAVHGDTARSRRSESPGEARATTAATSLLDETSSLAKIRSR